MRYRAALDGRVTVGSGSVEAVEAVEASEGDLGARAALWLAAGLATEAVLDVGAEVGATAACAEVSATGRVRGTAGSGSCRMSAAGDANSVGLASFTGCLAPTCGRCAGAVDWRAARV